MPIFIHTTLFVLKRCFVPKPDENSLTEQLHLTQAVMLKYSISSIKDKRSECTGEALLKKDIRRLPGAN